MWSPSLRPSLRQVLISSHEGNLNGHLCTAGFVELLNICSLRHHSHQWFSNAELRPCVAWLRVFLHADIHTKSGQWLRERLDTYTTKLRSAAEKFRSSKTLRLTTASRKCNIERMRVILKTRNASAVCSLPCAVSNVLV